MFGLSSLNIVLPVINFRRVETVGIDVHIASQWQLLGFHIVSWVVRIQRRASLCDGFCRDIIIWLRVPFVYFRSSSRGGQVLPDSSLLNSFRVLSHRVVLHEGCVRRTLWNGRHLTDFINKPSHRRR